MSRWNLAWLLGVPAVIIAGLTVVLAAPRPQKMQDQDYELIETFVEVYTEVDHKYVRELTPEQKRKFIADMINGGLTRLDPYSSFYDAEDFAQFQKQTEGAFAGVGIQVDRDRNTDLPMVTGLVVGSPAYDSGILAGDLILKVNGKSTEDLHNNEFVKMVQGDEGTDVTLTVLHEGSKESVDLTMKRARIEYPSIMGDRRKPEDPASWDFFVDKPSRIAYIRLVAFNEHSVADLTKAVEQVEREGARGLVLDLRDNPGGLLTQAVDICDLFMTGGPIVSTRNRSGKGKTYDAKADGTLLEPASAHPMAVLVNRRSASASEIVAAALQDSKRAVIVGERSFGKGSVQNVIELGNHEPKVALKLTTATYWRPSGANIHRNTDAKDTDEWGVKPSVSLEVKLTDKERIEYARWRRGRDVVHGKPGLAKKPDPEDKVDAASHDRYLEKALEYLRAELKK